MRPKAHGGSWHLPDSVARARVVTPFPAICARNGIRAVHCKQNLIDTP